MEPTLTLAEAQATVATKTAPKVTKESIEAAINQVSYNQIDTLTICIIFMKNGFKQIGKAAPASDLNFDAEVGKRLAYEDAFRGLWQLEGYLLCQKLYEASQAESAARQAAIDESAAKVQSQPATP